MMNDENYHKDDDHSSKDMEKDVTQQKAVANDAWAGYYDFIINEGSFKFWAAFQVWFILVIENLITKLFILMVKFTSWYFCIDSKTFIYLNYV